MLDCLKMELHVTWVLGLNPILRGVSSLSQSDLHPTLKELDEPENMMIPET